MAMAILHRDDGLLLSSGGGVSLWFLICDRKIADQENGGGHDVQKFDWLGAFTELQDSCSST